MCIRCSNDLFYWNKMKVAFVNINIYEAMQIFLWWAYNGIQKK
jgi:hypothetical protein